MSLHMKLPERLQKALSTVPEQPHTIRRIDLPMCEEGWNERRHQFPKETGIYILFAPNQRCLRVGIGGGANGIYGRWFASLSAHYSSYKGNCSEACKSYYYFYKQIEQVWNSIAVVFLTFPTTPRKEILEIEKLLIQNLSPIWEIRIDGKLLWSRATEEYLPSLDIFNS